MERQDIIIDNQQQDNHFEGGETDEGHQRKGSESVLSPETLNY